MDQISRVYAVYNSIIQQIPHFKPQVAIVCGTGLGSMAENIDSIYSIPFQLVKGMPKSTVDGHEGRFVFGYIESVPVLIMQGRIHFYEGYSAEEVVIPIRVMKLLGVECVILTNASGGITYTKPGTIMLIKDHISTCVPSPLIGKNYDSFGTRFPDMSEVYDKELIQLAKDVALSKNVELKEGVYMQFAGPQYETPAEIKMAKVLGADAVGMSTVIEAIAAAHAGMKVLGVSVISNPAAGVSEEKINHIDVQKTIVETADVVLDLGRSFINSLSEKNRW